MQPEFDPSRELGPDNPKEDVSSRGRHQRVYDIGPGRRRLCIKMTPMFFKNARNDWEPVSTDIENGGVHKCDYDVDLLPGKVGYSGTDPSGKKIELELEGVQWSEPIIEGNVARYVEVEPGVDFELTFNTTGIRADRVLKNAQANPTGTYRSEREAGALGQLIHRGEDDSGRRTRVVVQENPHGSGKGKEIVQEFKRQVMWMNPETRVREWTDAVTYPVRIDPTSIFTLGDNANDGAARTNSGSPTIGASMHYAEMYDSTTTVWVAKKNLWYRFPGITIPQGSTVNSATLDCYSLTNGVNSAKVMLDSRNNPPNPTAVSQVITPANVQGTVTHAFSGTKSIPSTPSDFVADSIDVTALVQALVTAHDYSNEAMAFYFAAHEPLQAFIYLYQRDRGTTRDAELVIDFTAAGGGGGWTGKVNDVTDPSKVQDVDAANIANIQGVT